MTGKNQQALEALERIIRDANRSERWSHSGLDIDTVRNALMRESVDVEPNRFYLIRADYEEMKKRSPGDLTAWDEELIDLYELKLGLLRTPTEGFVMVPVEPTEAMIEEAYVSGDIFNRNGVVKVYNAMIAAAQKDTP